MRAGLRRPLLLGAGALCLCAVFLAGRLTRPDAPDKPAAPPAAAAPPGQVTMGAQAQRNVGLEVLAAVPRELQRRLAAPAVVAADATRTAQLRPLGRGRVLRVAVAPGDAVTRGQVLLTYDDLTLSDLRLQQSSARAARAQADAAAATARDAYARGRALQGVVVPLAEVEHRRAMLAQAQAAVETQQATLADLSRRMAQFSPAGPGAPPGASAVLAPSEGYVLSTGVAPGDVVDPAQVVATVSDLSEVWVLAAVYQDEVGLVQAGGPATFRVSGLPGRVFEATVASVGRELNPRTGAVQVRCDVANPDRALRLGMFAQAELPTTRTSRTLTVPAAAVQQIDGHPVVFVRTGPETFERHGVELGLQTPEFDEVKSGIAPGDEVVTTGSFVLKSDVLQSQLGAGN